jgi:hypothetical protein
MHVELECHYHRGESHPFRVELLDHALRFLVADAWNAYRIYELFSIRRPGDVWKYLWARLIDVPERVWTRSRQARLEAQSHSTPSWPENTLPLAQFDQFFFWCWDDTEPEDECWLRAREGATFKAYATRLFTQVRETQATLRDSDDPLIQQELRALQAVDHPYDYEANTPFILTHSGYVSPTIHKRSPGYYAQLRELLARPDLRAVAYRGDEDFQTIRLLCTEQRRRAEALGKRPVEGLALCLLSDGVPAVTAWQAFVVYYSEGLGYGDLFIDQTDHSVSLKDLVEKHGRRWHWLLSYQDEGEIRGYQRTIGDGWICYEDQDPGQDYDPLSSFHHAQYIERYHRWVQHQEST